MLANNAYKEFARWREHWMSIMSPRSVRFELSTFKPDEKTPFALKEVRLRQNARALTYTRSSQEPSQTESTITKKVCSAPEKTDLEAYIWED